MEEDVTTESTGGSDLFSPESQAELKEIVADLHPVDAQRALVLLVERCPMDVAVAAFAVSVAGLMRALL